MDVNIQSTCDSSIATSTTCVYVGRLDNVQVSIPMLEAMGLILIWIVVCFAVSFLISKFT